MTLVIEELRKNKLLWKAGVLDGDELVYSYVHSIYGDRVYETYTVGLSGEFVLIKVTSTPLVLFSVYPGLELPPTGLEKSGNLFSVKVKKHQKTLIIAVGGEITDNWLTVGNKTIYFSKFLDQGTIVRVFLSKS